MVAQKSITFSIILGYIICYLLLAKCTDVKCDHFAHFTFQMSSLLAMVDHVGVPASVSGGSEKSM